MRADFCPCAVTVLDLDDLAVFRAHTSAQTAAKHINLHSVRLPCRLPQARTAAVTHLAFAPSAHPMPYRGPGRHEDRDYRTFAGAHRAQTTCASAHQRARKQAPQLVAQWLLRFSHTVSPRSSHTRPSSAHGRRACVQGAAPVARQHPRAPVDHWSSGPSCSCWPARCPGCCPPALRPATATPSAHRRYNGHF